VLKEALHLHPGVAYSLELHVPLEGTLIFGVNLSGGTNVSMSAPVVHMDYTVFGDDAGDFRPERWV
jgi:cytochrome P450